MGAKVASLRSDKHGLRYRSCTGRPVSEVILGQRMAFTAACGAGTNEKRVEVIDADTCREEGGYDLRTD
jgi:hypothetical protein